MVRVKRYLSWQVLVLCGLLGISGTSLAEDGSTGSGTTCPPPAQGAVLSDQNMDTFSSSSQSADDLLPDVPAPVQNSKPTAKLPLVQVSVNGQATTGAPKVTVVDIVALDGIALSDPTNPRHAQAILDVDAAASLFTVATSQTTCSGVTSAKATAAVRSGPGQGVGLLPINPLRPIENCSPNTYNLYLALMKQNQSLTFDAKIELLSSFLGSNLSALYNTSAGSSVTSLPTVFQALITGAKNAGVCRDIHDFIAVTGNALGLDCGLTGLDWNNGKVAAGHVIAHCKDPSSGQYVFIDYGDAFNSGSKFLSEAEQRAAENSNSYTTVVADQTVDAHGNGRLHVSQDARTLGIQQNIQQGSDMEAAHFTISVGNLETSASAKTKLVGDTNNHVGIFATGVIVQQGNPFQFAAVGARADGKKQIQITDNTQVSLSGTATAGVMDVHDHAPSDPATGYKGSGRNDIAYFANVDLTADYSWNESKNSGKVGIESKDESAFHKGATLADGFLPLFQLNVFATDNPTQNIQLHFKNSSFISTQSLYQTAPAIHEQDAAAGVDYHKSLNRSGTVQLQTGATVHDFDGKAIGVESETKVTVQKSNSSNFSLGANVGYVHNNSQDSYYNYSTTGSVEADYKKTFTKGALDVSGTYNYNQHDPYTLMPQGDLNYLANQPKAEGGVTWTFGHQE
jgi:hypothetical protein